jgi:hypothetical protein
MAENKIKPFTGEKALSDIFLVEGLVPPDILDTQAGSEVQKYSLISRNPIVKTALDIVESGVFWPNASIKANPQNDYEENPEFEEIDNDVISLLNSQLEQIGTDKKSAPNVNKTPKFKSVLKSVTRKGRIYGFSLGEMVWQAGDGIWWLRKIKPKPSWNFDFNIDEVDEMKEVVYFRTLEYLEPERFIVGVWPRLEDGNYYGVSDLQCIEDEVSDLEDLEKKLKKGTGWNAYRPLVVHVDSKVGTKEQQKNKETLKGLAGSVTATFPMIRDVDMKAQKAYVFEMLEDRASQYALEYGWNLLAEYIKRINRALGIPDELGQVTVDVGSNAKAQTQFNIFVATIEKQQEWVEELANRIIHTIIYYNYSNLPQEYKLPIWSFDAVEEAFKEAYAGYFKTLIDAGILDANEPFIREALEHPPKTGEEIQTDSNETDTQIQNNETTDTTMETNQTVTPERVMKQMKKAIDSVRRPKKKSFFRRLFGGLR